MVFLFWINSNLARWSNAVDNLNRMRNYAKDFNNTVFLDWLGDNLSIITHMLAFRL